MDSLRCLRPSTHLAGILVALACFVTLSSANSIKANYDFENYKAFEYDKAFFLQCNITASADMKFSLRWFKEDQPIVASEKYTIIDKENKLQISKANDGDVGNYTCQAVNAKTNATEVPVKAVFSVIGKPKISMPEDTPVVEGERLKLHCSVRGNPTPRVTWSINNNMPINTSDSRIKFDDDKNVKGAILIIENVQMADRNNYTCNAQNLAMQAQSSVMGWSYVRVKDKLAALWPFLGICAEVAVLCTIILIYEKKRNKTELDESDTDQSPEQKNTPDHGKDVRQRK